MAKKILCIEDDDNMRLSIRMMLDLAGYEIEEAKNGKAGVDQALKSPPDLIVCDIRMPILDGFQTLEELHKHESTAHIPFVFLTGEDPRTHLRKGMNLGASDFILKPIDVDDFLKAVQVRLEEAENRKNESQRAIDELSESITRALPHELRTPMTGILGLTELLQSSENLNPEEIKEITTSLSESAIRMNQTLEKFWIYTQCLLLTAHQEKLAASRQRGSRDAQAIAKHIAEGLAASAGREADLEMTFSPISVAISERYLEHILHQLTDNAFKFSSPGSRVKVSTSSINGLGTISINDQGRGMSEEQIKNIQTFMQFDRARHEQQGLGLGLTIAKRLTEMHEGTIQFNIAPGTGTTVVISFPLLGGKP